VKTDIFIDKMQNQYFCCYEKSGNGLKYQRKNNHFIEIEKQKFRFLKKKKICFCGINSVQLNKVLKKVKNRAPSNELTTF